MFGLKPVEAEGYGLWFESKVCGLAGMSGQDFIWSGLVLGLSLSWTELVWQDLAYLVRAEPDLQPGCAGWNVRDGIGLDLGLAGVAWLGRN